jgi:hypothetical protein
VDIDASAVYTVLNVVTTGSGWCFAKSSEIGLCFDQSFAVNTTQLAAVPW